MNTGRTILSQLFDFIPKYEFEKYVDKYEGNYRVKSFTCWKQFIVMDFVICIVNKNDFLFQEE